MAAGDVKGDVKKRARVRKARRRRRKSAKQEYDADTLKDADARLKDKQDYDAETLKDTHARTKENKHDDKWVCLHTPKRVELSDGNNQTESTLPQAESGQGQRSNHTSINSDSEPDGFKTVIGEVNGHPLEAIVDTGAVVTSVSEDFFHGARADDWECLHPDIVLSSADGARIHCVGRAMIPFAFGAQHYVWQTYVVRGLASQCILGADFLRHVSATVDYGKNEVRFQGKLVPREKGKPKPLDQRRVPVYTATTVKMKPNSAREIPVHVLAMDKKESWENIDWFFEPILTPATGDTWATRAVIRTDDTSYAYTGLVNVSTTRTHTIASNTLIGWATVLTQDVTIATIGEAAPDTEESKEERMQKFHEMLQYKLNESSDLSPTQKVEITEVLTRHVETLYAREVGTHQDVKCDIDVQGHRPIKQRGRQLSPKELSVIREEVSTLLSRGIIQESNSPWANRIVMVPKKDGATRVCVDFRAVNKMCLTDAYPTPLVAQTIDQVTGMNWFSNFDAESGYHQIQLTERAKPITAFSTPFGLYEYTKMPFGLKNAGACFQRVMDAALAGLSWKCCMVFVDDIIVFSRTWHEHLIHLDEVLSAIAKAGITLKMKKCHFAKKELEFLGVIVGKDGVRPDPQKIAAVKEFAPPKTKRQLRSFLGMATQLRKFIKDFAKKARPLTQLLRDDAQHRWKNMEFNTGEQEAFDTLKNAMVGDECLAYPNFNRPFKIVCDASNYALGAMLAQVDPETRQERPIMYASRVLKGAELNYSPTHKEGLAVVWSVATFRPYIHGVPSVVVTDHSALTWIMEHKEPTARMARWVMRIQEYDLEFVHRKGSENKIADALSRMERLMTQVEESETNENHRFDAQEEHLLMRVHKTPVQTPECQKDHGLAQLNDDNIESWKKDQLKEKWMKHTHEYLHDGTLPESKQEMTRVLASQGQFVVIDKLLRRIVWVKEGKQSRLHTPLVVPRSKVKDVLQMVHDAPATGAHMGVERTMAKTVQAFWWPQMYTDIKQYIDACEKCQRTKSGKKKKAILGGHPMGAAPFDLIACDLLSMPESSVGNKYILMVADYFTRFLIAVPVKDKAATTIACSIMNEVLLKYGPPRRILTDNGGEFKNELLEEVCSKLKTQKLYTSPYHPQTDGVVERLNQTILNMMSVYVDSDQKNWDTILPYIVFAHNAAPTTATGVSPFKALFGRNCPTPIQLQLEPSYEKLQGKDMNQTWQEMQGNM